MFRLAEVQSAKRRYPASRGFRLGFQQVYAFVSATGIGGKVAPRFEILRSRLAVRSIRPPRVSEIRADRVTTQVVQGLARANVPIQL